MAPSMPVKCLGWGGSPMLGHQESGEMGVLRDSLDVCWGCSGA